VRNTKLGFVFQDFMLLDGLSVRDNIILPRIISGKVSTEMQQSADHLCKVFNIAHIKNKYPAEISGGERQRTAVARALINNPLLILADEPTGNLDSKNSRAVIDSFKEAQSNLSATIFMVTHDSFAASFCDRVILMKDGVVYGILQSKGMSQRAFQDVLLDSIRQMSNETEESA
jgi:ABC-type lipoprotein export system ATPase subunit